MLRPDAQIKSVCCVCVFVFLKIVFFCRAGATPKLERKMQCARVSVCIYVYYGVWLVFGGDL